MIVHPGEDVVPKHVEHTTSSGAVPSEPPPSYTSNLASTTTSPDRAETGLVVPNIKPTNYISLSRTASVKGAFIIDPSLQIPSSFLPPLANGETEATRCNLRLLSKHEGIDVDVFIVCEDLELGRPPPRNGWRVTMDMSASHGSITARLHVPNANSRPSLRLKAYAPHGNIRIRIPRSFQGPITTATCHGSIKFSDEVSTNLTIFSEVDNTNRSFVGDLSMWTEGVEWEGDQVTAKGNHGTVKVQYDDEVIEDFESTLQTKFSRIGRIFKF